MFWVIYEELWVLGIIDILPAYKPVFFGNKSFFGSVPGAICFSSKLCPVVFSVCCDKFYSKFICACTDVISCVWVCSSPEFGMRFEVCLSLDVVREVVCLSSLYTLVSFI